MDLYWNTSTIPSTLHDEPRALAFPMMLKIKIFGKQSKKIILKEQNNQ